MPCLLARVHPALRYFLGAVVCLLGALPLGAQADQPKAKVVEDVWEAAYIDGVKNGHVHFTIEEIERDGQKILRATKQLRLTLARDGQRAEVKADVGTEEAADGAVVGVFMRQWIGKQQSLVLQGRIDGKVMRVKVEGPTTKERELGWNPKIVGLIGEQRLLSQKKAAPGDKFEYLYYEPTVNAVVTVRAAVKELEETALPGGTPRKLLRVEVNPAEVLNVQLPGSVQWVDPKTYEAVKTQGELPGLGDLVLVRTTREAALAPPGKSDGTSNGPDVIGRQSIRLSKRIEDVHAANAVTYRITLQSPNGKVEGIVARDARQRIINIKDKSFDLLVEAVREPGELDPLVKREPVAQEYRVSNRFITSDDPKVRELAQTATQGKTDAWDKARAIERWVRQNMKAVDYTEALATADHVARTLSGDCTEYAMLAAAMCRAENIPSRTAIGLVYVDHSRHGPMLAFHMWTEVYVKGQWLAIDATLGRGSVGPGHIKITDHHWNNVDDFSPLLPVTRFILARPAVDVISYRRSN